MKVITSGLLKYENKIKWKSITLVQKRGVFRKIKQLGNIKQYKMKKLIIAIFCILPIFLATSCGSGNSASSIEGTKNCLKGYDWVYPSASNPTGAWKFSNDGSFSFSSTNLGGMSTWGNWSVVRPGKVKLQYNRSTTGNLPDDQILTLKDCNTLIVGSTPYKKMN